MRLIDKIHHHGVKEPDGTRRAPSLTAINFRPGDEIFSIDNIARAYFDHPHTKALNKQHGHGWDMQKDFPFLTPPYPDGMWMEFSVPPEVRIELDAPHSVGIMFRCEDGDAVPDELALQEPDVYKAMYRRMQDHRMFIRESHPDAEDELVENQAWWYTMLDAIHERIGDDTPSGVWEDTDDIRKILNSKMTYLLRRKQVRWVTAAHIYVELSKNQVYGPIATYFFPVAAHGEAVAGLDGPLIAYAPSEPGASAHYSNSNVLHATESLVPWTLYPCLFSISLLHCKNTKIIRGEPNEQLRKKHVKRKRQPPVSFKILDVTPMKARSQGASVSTRTGDSVAAHMVRGHFKDYRDGGGLFGRHKGRYFWGPSMRGDLEEGYVDKDYNVKAPEKSGEVA